MALFQIHFHRGGRSVGALLRSQYYNAVGVQAIRLHAQVQLGMVYELHRPAIVEAIPGQLVEPAGFALAVLKRAQHGATISQTEPGYDQ